MNCQLNDVGFVFVVFFSLLMDSGAVRLSGMGELYFSPSSASYSACDLQGVACSDAAFAVYKIVHILLSIVHILLSIK